MKRITFFICIALTTITSFGQEFLGIKVEGNREQVISLFKSKGFVLSSGNDMSKNVVRMEGNAAGKKIELGIVSTPISKTVWKFAIYLPEQSTWSSLKSDYEEYLKILTDKYGEPKSKYNFFSSPYKEGDGYEMTAVSVEKCGYAAFWPDNKNISLKISKWKQVCINYENTVNSALDDKEKATINSNTF